MHSTRSSVSLHKSLHMCQLPNAYLNREPLPGNRKLHPPHAYSLFYLPYFLCQRWQLYNNDRDQVKTNIPLVLCICCNSIIIIITGLTPFVLGFKKIYITAVWRKIPIPPPDLPSKIGFLKHLRAKTVHAVSHCRSVISRVLGQY